ncbi:MAG: hypothetical protein GF383_03535 [Candidatus Lokiarchaeota archaeon]|nr:hypothetical protein [Candidatus Lokiarchaeota archaeon]MBD3338718.1 hypothetical protein [Candidatus Lokiarchaeota archaeon]
MYPKEVADITFRGIKDEKLYIITHKDSLLKRMVKERFDEILKAFNKIHLTIKIGLTDRYR